ncbi:MAG: beta-galactosidase [Actinophytocola sp.]|uniref:glycoside hydrolase family 2 TIM barrel-domain containing protein n=1 Tax=Actinophytocola sp. TaxID=1872138 RepID=UPI0013218489|nr:glycoside hydrolase family 2 TIM barrel-domain containing protein [Actinophytocola sp.]MPZ82795.1 beta-galactosidase [Actinophytocola sp.]
MMTQAATNGLPRRGFLRATVVGTACLAAWSVLGSGRGAAAERGPAAKVVPFNAGWLVGKESPGSTKPVFDDSNFATVTLPNTVTNLSWQKWDPQDWERVWVYRKHFDAPADVTGMRVFLDFGAALIAATPTLNGRDLPGHAGGYLPFSVEITDDLRPTGNVLAVTVDSRTSLNVPPNRPENPVPVDFWQPGGIYRDVVLRAVPQVFLADVFAKPVDVLDAAARRLVVECTADAAVVPQGRATVKVELRDGERVVATETAPLSIGGPGRTVATVTLTGLADVRLWGLDEPRLYDVVTTLLVDGLPLHDHRTRVGFRDATFRKDGFFLNGERVKLFGVNRHQFYPFTGGAMSARVQRRDAEILRRELNCNMVRCAHYPHSDAFLDACDELGLMVWEEAPGWGYLGDDAYLDLVYRDVGDMVRRDRNRPSVIIWGARLNETSNNVPFYTRTRDLAHALDGSRPTVGAMSGKHDTPDYVQDVFAQNDYAHTTGPDGRRQPALLPPRTDRPYMVSETVGTLSGPSFYYRRTDAQDVQQGQATAHARAHDTSASDDRYCGLLAWTGFDYPSGNGNQFMGVKYTGVVDLFRIRKPGAAIYEAQVDPRVRPVIAPAFYWDFGPTSPVTSLSSAMICSNLDRLELFVGGEHHATGTPDTANYGHLRYPPTFVDLTTVDGSKRPELRIDGYLGSTKVASVSLSSDTSTDRLALVVDDAELLGDGVDMTRLKFRAVDRHGAPRPYLDGQVELAVDGPLALVGDNPFDFAATGGAGAVWLRTIPNSPGEVTVRATHPVLGTASARVLVRQQTPGGRPALSGSLQARSDTGIVTEGDVATVSATFVNSGLPDLGQATLTLTPPDGWPSEPLTATTFRDLGSGATVRASWKVTVPQSATAPSAALAVKATYRGGDQRGVTDGNVRLLVPYGSLAVARNNIGITDAATRLSGAIDGSGDSFDSAELVAAGLAPGATVARNGFTFTWPDVPPGQQDNVVTAAQIIAVPAATRQLAVLATSVNAQSDTSVDYLYTDGSAQTCDLTVSYWRSSVAAADNELVARVATYRKDRRQGSGSLFFVPLPAPANGKQLKAITLPISHNVHIFALELVP